MIMLDLSFVNVHRQYLACRKNKRNTANALKFEANQEAELLKLHHELQTKTYEPGRSVCFYATKPKLREIFAADFRDRIVHHILVAHLEQYFEPKFIFDSYACRKAKGIHAGVKRLQTFSRQITQNNQGQGYYLQLDVHNFFMSIDKNILYQQLSKCLQGDENARWLCRLSVYHDCRSDYLLKGNTALQQAMPPHKTLFHCADDVGLPIGNLNSQFFANVYLNALDQFVKHTLKCRYYLRYCDDFILLADNEAQLLVWREQIRFFLHDTLALTLNPKQLLLPISNGINFLGYIVRPKYLLVRRRVVNQLKQKLASYQRLLCVPHNNHTRYLFDNEMLDALHATLASYLGHFKLANSIKLEHRLWHKHPWLRHYFEFSDTGIVRKYAVPRQFDNVKHQYLYFRWQFGQAIVLFEVGKYIEFYHQDDKAIANVLGLKPLSCNKRRALFGFPVHQLPHVMQKLVSYGHACCFIGQDEGMANQLVTRSPKWLISPVE